MKSDEGKLNIFCFLKHKTTIIYYIDNNYKYFRHPLAANLYPWSTDESLMRLARRSSMPPLPDNLQQLATIFENGQLPRYSCCDITIFRSCVQDIDGKNSMIFACPVLTQNIVNTDIEELHVDGTFKVVPARMGYQMLTIHVMIQNYVSLGFLKLNTYNFFNVKSLFTVISNNICINGSKNKKLI